MRSLIHPIQRRGKEYHVVMRSGRTEYASTCYAKAVGVHEYLEQRQAGVHEYLKQRQAALKIREKLEKSTTRLRTRK